MTALFLRIVNMSIAASWLILAVLVIRQLLRRAPKGIRAALWGLVGIRLALPFSLESVFSLIPSAETIHPEIMMDSSPAVDTGIAGLDRVVNPVMAGSVYSCCPEASAKPFAGSAAGADRNLDCRYGGLRDLWGGKLCVAAKASGRSNTCRGLHISV